MSSSPPKRKHEEQTIFKLGVFLLVLLLYFRDVSAQNLKSDSDLFPDGDRGKLIHVNPRTGVFTQVFWPPFKFLNRSFNEVYISQNGLISFGTAGDFYNSPCSPNSVPTIMAFALTTGMIPTMFYKVGGNKTQLERAANEISRSFPEVKGLTLRWMATMTWYQVPRYGGIFCGPTPAASKQNIYQITLATDGVSSFATLYYDRLDWATGNGARCEEDPNGIGVARAGIDFGDKKTFHALPGSCTKSVVELAGKSNVGKAGRWIFKVDSLDICGGGGDSCSGVDENNSDRIMVRPSVVSYMGNVRLTLGGFCVKPNLRNVSCIYDDLVDGAVRLNGAIAPDGKSVVCPTPGFSGIGKTAVNLKLVYIGGDELKEVVYKGHLLVTGDEPKEGLKVNFTRTGNQDAIIIKVEWSPSSLSDVQKDELVDLQLGALSNGRNEVDRPVFKTRVKNTGSFEATISKQSIVELFRSNAEDLMATMTLENVGGIVKKLFVNPLTFTRDLAEVIVDKFTSFTNDRCHAWKRKEPPPPTDTRPCPPTAALARIDDNFIDDGSNFMLKLFHPGGVYSRRQRVPSPSGAGSQCVYNEKGCLLVGPPGGGTLDKVSPERSKRGHFKHDVLPYLICCRLSGAKNEENCRDIYYALRPTDDGTNYARPKFVRAVGDPHIGTFDGLGYTFNGIGEFIMVQLNQVERNLTFKMQVRMEQYKTAEGVGKDASVFIAAAMEEVINGEKVTIQVAYNRNGIEVFLDGDLLVEIKDDLGVDITLPHKSAHVAITSPRLVTVAFSSSFSFTFSTIGVNEAGLNIVGMAADPTLENSTMGLMGNFDGDPDNDFILPDGSFLPSNSTAAEDIHYQFGLKWMVSEEDSIFTYSPGMSYSDYSKPDFKPKFPTNVDLQPLPKDVLETCGANMECAFDFMATGSEVFANQTKDANQKYNAVVEIASQVVKLCPGGSLLQVENGYAEITDLQIGGVLIIGCRDGFKLENGPVYCTCEDRKEEDPAWACTNHEELPIRCIPIEDLVECDPPPPLKNGMIIGANFGVGSTIKLECNPDFEIFWGRCKFNGDGGICKAEGCNLTYTCMKEVSGILENGTKNATGGVWRGYAGDIEKIGCHSQFRGRMLALIRAASVVVHVATRGELRDGSASSKKPYLIGC